MGKPTGGGGPGGGGDSPCAKQTVLINTNKMEAAILLFCIIMETKCIKKKRPLKQFATFSLKKSPQKAKKIDEIQFMRVHSYSDKMYFLIKMYERKKLIPQFYFIFQIYQF